MFFPIIILIMIGGGGVNLKISLQLFDIYMEAVHFSVHFTTYTSGVTRSCVRCEMYTKVAAALRHQNALMRVATSDGMVW